MMATEDQKSSQQVSHLTVSTTPFTLTDFDSKSCASSGFSTTDGIDILGAEPSPTNFREWSHQRSGRIITSRRFKRCVLTLILINSLLLGVATWDIVRDNEKLSRILDRIFQFFLLLFTVEVLAEFAYYQHKILQMGWVLFDIGVLTLSWFLGTTWLVLRAFRLIRALRKASGLVELKLLVKALLKGVPKMLAIVVLFLVLFYIFAVIFTDFYQDVYNDNKDEISENYFGRLDRTAFTLFRVMTLDDWSSIAKEIMQVYRWSWTVFLSFIVTSLFFGSLIVGVVVDSVQSVSQERLWKSFQDANDIQPSNTKEMQRFERKLDDLSNTVDQLVRMQLAMQESLNRLNQQEVAKQLRQATSLD